MKLLKNVALFVILFSVTASLYSQDSKIKPSYISQAIYFDKIGPIRDLPAMSQEDWQHQIEKAANKDRNFGLGDRIYPFAESSLPKGPDPVWQKEMGITNSANRDLISEWDGINSPYYPPDCNGAVGSDYFFQAVNTSYSIYDKNGNQVVPATAYNTLFSGVPGATHNDGDPIILYDDQAERWLAAEFAGVSSSPDYMLIAVSETDDPTGSWYRWSFVMNGFPDYMKFGVWRDGYYMSANSSGNDIYVFDRNTMLAGGATPAMVGFNNPNRPNSGFHCIQPLDNDGQFAPNGTPGMFITINDDSWGGSDQLWMFELDVDWNTPSNSTFGRTQMINVASFDSQFNSWGVGDITQPGTSQKLDAIPMILMYRAQYRNFGSSENIVVCHTVDVNSTNWAGIRWYELEKSGSSWSVRQQGTYAPDSDNRWMGSIAMNGNHEIGLAYSVSSSSTYPSIRYAGQSASENTNATGILDYTENSILVGANSQSAANRWGDYSLLSIDPDDDHTFWFTTEYIGNGGSRKTKIASFEFAPPPLTANFVGNPTSGYAALTVNFTDLSSGSIDDWLWDFGDGNNSTSRNPSHTYTEVGIYTVSLTIFFDGESNTKTIVDYIEVIQPPDPPEADFTSDVTTGEDPLVVNFTDLSTNDAVSWYWEFGDGSWSTLQNPNYLYYVPGVYTVSLTSTGIGGTSDTETKIDYIVVTASAPIADFNGIPAYGIAPLTVNFTDLSDGFIETWHWDFGDGHTSEERNPEHTFVDADDYSITLTVTGPGGTETLTKEDFIDVRDVLSLTVSAVSEQVCIGESTQLFAEASGGTESYTFNWTSEPAGFVSDEQNPIITPEETTVYIVELNDGEETIEGEIEIIVRVLPEITLGEWPEVLCIEEEPPVQLTAMPEGGVYTGPNVSEDGIFTPEEATVGYNVITYTYEDENGCVNSAQDSIYVDQCVGLNKVNEELESVLVFPNPNAGIFTVESSKEDILKIEVYDQNGKLVFLNNSKAKSIRISLDLTPGTYYLRTFVNSTDHDMSIITKEILIK